MWCNATCLPSNPRNDSIHVDAAAIAQDAARRAREEQEQAERRREEELQQLMAEEQEQEREAEKQQKEEEDEQLRREKEEAAEAERSRRAFEQEQQRLQQEQRRRDEEQQREQEEESHRKETERLEREQQQKQERQERQEALKFFCRRHGFTGATEPRRNGCAVFGSTVTYPLHQAAELADARIVEMLLKEGASPMMKNGSKLTAAQVAQKMNKGGSHDGVLQALKTAAAGGA